MSASLLTDQNVIVGVIVAGVGAVVRALVSLRKVHLRERSTTERLARALQDSSPAQRPEIIRALGGLADQSPPRDADGSSWRTVLKWLSSRTPPSIGGR